MENEINGAILQIVKRADKCDKNTLVETFVNLGSLLPLLKGCDNHILYGRRGTGKTHILSYLCTLLEKQYDCPIYIDLRILGSTNSIYTNNQLPIEQRVTRLVIDIFSEIHDQINSFITQNDTAKEQYIVEAVPILSKISEELSQISIIGDTTVENRIEMAKSNELELQATIGTSSGLEFGTSKRNEDKKVEQITQHGTTVRYLHFPSIMNLFKDLLSIFSPHRIWIILDEFSEIPYDLQPYLSDMLRRTLAPLNNIVIKIGAIEHRTNLKIQIDNKQYMGLEIGADIYSCNLDDYMVFNNNDVQTLFFFKELLYRHINSLLPDGVKYNDSTKLISDLFTQEAAFEELARAAEGVPRDAFNILSVAVTNDFYNKVSVPNIRQAAKKWYNQDKEASVKSYKEARNLLNWIIDTVIGERHARAFLLQSDENHELIDFLYDARVLHIIKQSVSSRDTPGTRYNVYSIDYGCYVDLINTSRNPKGLFEVEDENGENDFCKVPQNDYRSIRRAILNMAEFDSHIQKINTR